MASALVLALSFLSSGAAKLQVQYADPDQPADAFEITTASVLSFDAGDLLVKPDGSQPTAIPLAGIKSIKFEASQGALEQVADDNVSLRLRRNPVADILEVEGSVGNPATLEIFAVSGVRVLAILSWQGESVDVTSLANGLYILRINNNAIKFIKI